MPARRLGEMATSTAGSSLTRLSDQGHQAPAMVIPPRSSTKVTRDRNTLSGPCRRWSAESVHVPLRPVIDDERRRCHRVGESTGASHGNRPVGPP